MGYDCTLHAVDEAALKRFAEELTGKTTPKGDTTLFKKVRAFLEEKDPDAGLAVTELALLRASASGPHLTTRGVALSLWDEKLLGPTPWKLFGSLERGPLAGLRKKWKSLRLPTGFESNYCTGVFVGAAEVPALLAELGRRFAAKPKGTTRDWAPLLKILAIAARHRFAYWEGTDLAVRQSHREWLEEEKPTAKAKLQTQRISFGYYPRLLAADGATMVVSNLDPYCTWVVDLRAWPPRVTTHKGFFSADAALSSDGRIAFWASANERETPRRFHLHLADDASKKPRAVGTLAEEDVQAVRFLGDQPMLFSQHPGEGPWVLEGKKLTKARGLPKAVGFRNSIRIMEVPYDTGAFGDGTPLLVWDGNVLVKQGAKYSRLLKAKLRPEIFGGTSTLTLDDHTVLMLDGRKLVTVNREGKLQRPFKKATNVMAIRGAEDGAVVLHQGNHDEGHAAKVWWPAQGEYVGVDPEDFGVDEVNWVVWAKQPRLLVACVDKRLIALDAASVFSKKRVPAT